MQKKKKTTDGGLGHEVTLWVHAMGSRLEDTPWGHATGSRHGATTPDDVRRRTPACLEVALVVFVAVVNFAPF